MNPHPDAAPEGRKIQCILPISRDELWLCTEDEDFTDEPDGKRYSLRLLHAKAGVWTEHPFHGNDVVALALEGGEITAFDDGREQLAFPGAYGSEKKRVKETYDSIRCVAKIDGAWWLAGGNGKVFVQVGNAWKERTPPWRVKLVQNETLAGIAGKANDLIAVGGSTVWHWNGKAWSAVPGVADPSSLAAVCAVDATFYAAGWDGALWRGDASGFTKVCKAPHADAHLRELAWFGGRLYVAADTRLYALRGAALFGIDMAPWSFSDDFAARHTLHAAAGLLWSKTESEVRFSADGKAWTTFVAFPVEAPFAPPPPRKGPPPRKPRAAELAGLAPETRAVFAKTARIDPLARVTPAKTKAALAKHGYAAHPKALAFDKAYAGLFTTTSEDDEASDADQWVAVGIHAMLEGPFHDVFRPWAPSIDDSDDETVATTTPDRERAKPLTPVAVIPSIECVVFMDASGKIHVWGSTQGEWFPGEASGVAFLDQFARDNGAKATKPKKPKKPKKPAKPKPRR